MAHSTEAGGSFVQDPRWVELNAAHTEVSKGLDAAPGSHERYQRAQQPYVELLAEHCPPTGRKYMMASLAKGGIDLALVARGFKADEAEIAYVREHGL